MNIKGEHYRTIWPLPDNSGNVRIIDQRHLPHELVFEDLCTVDDFAAAIKEMHVRGAGLIGATAGFGMYMAGFRASDDINKALDKAASKLIATRPTASNLAWAVERQLRAVKDSGSPEEKKNILFDTACLIADEDADFCRQLGEHGLEIIKEISIRKKGKPVNILTHCNAGWLAFVDYGSATSPIYAAHREGIKVHVWVDETRPWLQGAKLTAWELKEEGVPHTLVADNAGGHLMQHDMVDMVIVGTDRTTYTGDVANKIGTYLKALAAKDNNVPFYVALPSSTFDWQIRDGVKDIPIEQRTGNEICNISGVTSSGSHETVGIAPKNTPTANYGFDVTPSRLITGLVTERGICKPDEDDVFRLYPEKK